jgi:hypothetical protein
MLLFLTKSVGIQTNTEAIVRQRHSDGIRAADGRVAGEEALPRVNGAEGELVLLTGGLFPVRPLLPAATDGRGGLPGASPGSSDTRRRLKLVHFRPETLHPFLLFLTLPGLQPMLLSE